MFPTSPKKLERYLRYLGAAPQKKWGQNFLLNNHYHLKIVQAANLTDKDVVLEIGPGLGHLTYFLQPHPHKIWVAEIDPIMVTALKNSFKEADNLEILNMDVLRKKNSLNSELMEIIFPFLDQYTFKLIANLPYNISAPVIINFLKLTTPPKLMVLMVQKEIALRLTAKPQTEFYGPLTVQAQLRGQVKILHDVPSEAFFPQPKVISSIIEIVPNSSKVSEVIDIEIFEKLVQSTFCLRRKKLSNSLAHSSLFPKKDKSILSHLQEKIDLSRRPETLSVEEFIQLANWICKLNEMENKG